MVNKLSNFRPSFVPISATTLALLLTACGASNLFTGMGLLTPTATPDPYRYQRAMLQPQAQADIEAVGPLPYYHITARLNQAGDALSGVMRVTLPLSRTELVFRLYPALENYGGTLDITQARLNGRPVDIVPLANNTAIRLNQPIEELVTDGPPTVVELAFTTQLPQGSGGAGDGATLFGWQDETLSLPGFYPTLAVKQNNGWVLDDPPPHGDVLFNEVALYQLDLTLPSELAVVSSGVTLNILEADEQRRTWQIAGGPLRDMTVIAGPFKAIHDQAAGATVTAYYLPGHRTGATAVLGHATASLRLYSDIYGPYPYTELDVVAAPLGYRGMEYSGLILIGADLYANPQEELTFLVAHEVAHQWWYALVGNNPYRHPWLDEGLTEYSAFDYYRGVFGQSAAEALLLGRWQTPFSVAAQGGIVGQVDQPAADFAPANYELLVYGKAALFFNALRQQLGDETYRRVLQTYYAENRYQIATPQTFFDTAGRVSGQNLTPLARQWLE